MPDEHAAAEMPPILTQPTLHNALWYGSSLVSFLATSETTGGQYALLHVRIQRTYTPLTHRHGPEAFYILRGRVRFDVAGEQVIAGEGCLVTIPANAWHTFFVESEEAEYLIIASPPGFEQLFVQAGTAAEALELPSGRVGPPDIAVMRTVAPHVGIELAPPGISPGQLSNRAGME